MYQKCKCLRRSYFNLDLSIWVSLMNLGRASTAQIYFWDMLLLLTILDDLKIPAQTQIFLTDSLHKIVEIF